MGLDTSHDCWHGPYSAFSRWRIAIAQAAGIPLMLMDGFHERPSPEAMKWAAPRDGGPECRSPYGPSLHRWCSRVDALLPISWDSLRPDPIHALLNHSDCDGEILAADCGPIADRLAELLPLLPDVFAGERVGVWRDKTQTFIDGLRRAAAAGEDVGFY